MIKNFSFFVNHLAFISQGPPGAPGIPGNPGAVGFPGREVSNKVPLYRFYSSEISRAIKVIEVNLAKQVRKEKRLFTTETILELHF